MASNKPPMENLLNQVGGRNYAAGRNRLAAEMIINVLSHSGPAYMAVGGKMADIASKGAAALGTAIPGPVGSAIKYAGPALVAGAAYKAATDDSREREQLRLNQIAAAERAHKHAVDLAYHQENARLPGNQAEGQAKLLEAQGYLEKSRAEAAKTRSEVGEAQAQDILNFGRSIYGTGLRA